MKKPFSKNPLASALMAGFVVFSGAVAGDADKAQAADKVLHIAMPFGPTNSAPDPRARQNGWLSNRAGVSETLVGMTYEMEKYPRLASAYENLSPTEWKITLRKGVKFHDGSGMFADDVKASFDKLAIEGHSAHNPRLLKLLDIKEIRKVDDHTLIFETNKPNAAFLWSLSEPSAAVLKEGTDSQPIIGTGPFTFSSAKPDKQYVTKAFADYWGGKPKLTASSWMPFPMRPLLRWRFKLVTWIW